MHTVCTQKGNNIPEYRYLQERCRYRLLKIEDCFNFLNKQKYFDSSFFFLKMSLLQFINSEIFFVISVTLLYA